MGDFYLERRQVLCHVDQVPFVQKATERHVDFIVAGADKGGLVRAINTQNLFALARDYRPNIRCNPSERVTFGEGAVVVRV